MSTFFFVEERALLTKRFVMVPVRLGKVNMLSFLAVDEKTCHCKRSLFLLRTFHETLKICDVIEGYHLIKLLPFFTTLLAILFKRRYRAQHV